MDKISCIYWLIPDFHYPSHPIKVLWSIAVRPLPHMLDAPDRHNGQRDKRTNERTDRRTDGQRGASLRPSVRLCLRWSLTVKKLNLQASARGPESLRTRADCQGSPARWHNRNATCWPSTVAPPDVHVQKHCRRTTVGGLWSHNALGTSVCDSCQDDASWRKSVTHSSSWVVEVVAYTSHRKTCSSRK